MNMISLTSLIDDKRDAERWRKLIRLTGSTLDGSDTTVKLFWDDATRSSHIMVGKEFYGTDNRSFESVIDSISESSAEDHE